MQATRRMLLAALAGTLALPGTAVRAQGGNSDFPKRAVRLVLPFSPGGTTDFMARLLSAKFLQETGQTLVVDNKPGAGGMIGTEIVARAPADGYTLLLASSAQLALNPALYPDIRYDPVRDFTPVTLLGATPNVLLATPGLPVSTLPELIALARAKPGQLSFASPGTGSTAHLAAELLKLRAGIQMTHVPYRGAGPAVTDALGGQVPLILVAITSIVEHVKSGRLHALAVTGAKRSPALPDVPTVAETLPGFEATAWYGIIAPAGTPPEIVARLHDVLRRCADMPDLRAAWAAQGIDPLGGSSADFARYIKSEVVKWGDVVRRSGAKVE